MAPSRKHKKKVKAPRKPLSRKSAKLITLAVCLVVFGAMAAAISYYFFDKDVLQARITHLASHSNSQASSAAQSINDFISAQRNVIVSTAIDQKLARAVRNKEERSIEAFLPRIKRDVDNLHSVRVFQADTEPKPEPDSTPSIGFVELSMIRNVDRGSIPFPEIVKTEDDWKVLYAAPIKQPQSDFVEGILLAWTDINEVEDILNKYADDGEIILEQKFERSRKVTSISRAGTGNYDESFIAPIEDTPFALRFTPDRDKVNFDAIEITRVLIIAGAAFFVLLTSGLLVGNWLGKKIALRIPEPKTVKQASLNTRDGLGAVPSSVPQAARNILDVEVREEDEALLGIEDEELVFDIDEDALETKEEAEVFDPALEAQFPLEVFRAYDIRGLAGDVLTREFAQAVGKAFASQALDAGEKSIIVARDARISSPELFDHLLRGIISTGCDVINIGSVPTPLLYFACSTLDASASGVIVTASHNDKEYNGFKFVLNGMSRSDDDITAIRTRILRQQFPTGRGKEDNVDIIPAYVDAVFGDVALAGDLKIVIDAANGIAGKVAPKVFEELGCEVIPLFCDLDGNFPNHSPDPSKPENLKALQEKVLEESAHLGVAFDGDGDRVVAVTPAGKIIEPDRLIMLFAKDIVSRNPGADVVYDVKCTRLINQVVSELGGRPIIGRTGHSPMKAKMNESGALLGGEYSGHIYIKDRWYGFDDAIYAAARLAEIISLSGETLDQMISEFPAMVSTPEYHIPVKDARKFAIIEKLVECGDFGDANINHIDGVRADFKHGWGLVRASNTSAALSLRFEAETKEEVHQLKALFMREIRKVDKDIQSALNS